jgi:hypothetical protein
VSGKHPLPLPGAFMEARYPFIRDAEGALSEIFDGYSPWKPGVRPEHIGPDDYGMVADAEGTIILTVVATYKPGRFPTRVFFTRRWRDPDGREFGKSALRMATVANLYALARGYRHEYEMAAPAVAEPPP